MKKKIELGNFGTRSVCFLSYRDQEHDKNMDTTKSDTNADVKGLYYIFLSALDECCLSEKAREVMELVETARIWYVDSGANIQFQLVGPILGAAILAVCKELMKKNLPSPKIPHFSGIHVVAAASRNTQWTCQWHAKCRSCRFLRLFL